ncbi:hypothetical protein NDU88_005479 [Pleurodeles waltl]|uniref:Rx N-terminal domain-containing protein n=1 Tax=Pleurodeles waltl TaxID=8319 RepID=A0AAV7LPA5_PLEWA|nr:hypothetical protein NDU88_005479 [Pleurodeles waltl]
MERILQEIIVVVRWLKGMDAKISGAIRADIAGFRDRVTGVDRCLTTLEDRLYAHPVRDQELMHLRNKLTDLEDRSRRDNMHFLAFWNRLRGRMPESSFRTFSPLLWVFVVPMSTHNGSYAQRLNGPGYWPHPSER